MARNQFIALAAQAANNSSLGLEGLADLPADFLELFATMVLQESAQAEVTLQASRKQAEVVCAALDLYSRLGLGQLEQIEEQARWQAIPLGPIYSGRAPEYEVYEAVRGKVAELKALMGYQPHHSWSIGAPAVPEDAKRAYEVLGSLRKALAPKKATLPIFKGLRATASATPLRYTTDKLPVVTAKS